MTAAVTPRLGLLLPASSDNFVIDDFDTTMTTLDNTPGITPVANYSSLNAMASTLTSAQDGSIYLQADNGSLWQWVKPGSAAGSFRKINTTGLLVAANQPSAVSTSTTDPNSGPAIINTTFTFPGGRTVVAFFSHSSIVNSGSYGYSIVDMWINGGIVETSLMSGGAANKGISHRLFQPFGAPTGSTVTIKISMRSSGYGGGTTSTNATGQLYVFEI